EVEVVEAEILVDEVQLQVIVLDAVVADEDVAEIAVHRQRRDRVVVLEESIAHRADARGHAVRQRVVRVERRAETDDRLTVQLSELIEGKAADVELVLLAEAVVREVGRPWRGEREERP